MQFYRIHGMTRARMNEWKASALDGRKLHPPYPHLIQHATSADKTASANDIYNEYPRGTEIFHPVWDAADFPHNMAGYDPCLYVASAFLE